MERIRRAVGSDAPQLAHFGCANRNEKWTRVAQDIVRFDVAPDVAEGRNDFHVLVAVVEADVVGVVAYGPDPYGHVHIHVLAVRHDSRRQGIGTRLKQQVLETTQIVTSSVHRRNFAMQGLNGKLNVQTHPDPDDGEMLVSVVRSHRSKP